MEQERDENLWRKAKRITKFKRHLYTYLVINVFLWIIWLFNFINWGMGWSSYSGIPWPVWVSIGWGIGLAFDYYDSYHYDGINSTEKEYQKLKKK